MQFGADLFAFLTTDSAILSAVSTRVYPIQLPQKPTLPAVRYTIVSGVRTHSQPSVHGLARLRIQIDCYAETYAAAYSMAELVRLRLDTYRGTMGTVAAQGVFLISEDEIFESEQKAYNCSRDYYVWLNQA